MYNKKNIVKSNFITIILIGILSVALAGCGSDSDDGSGVGYLQLYNASSNSPSIYLTVEKYDDDEYDGNTHAGVSYTKSGGYYNYETETYDIELSWQDGDDYDDLEVVYQNQLKVSEDIIQLIVIAEDIQAPNVLTFEIPLIEDDSDYDDDLFNLRFLNMHPIADGFDIHISESNESFNEAILLGQYNYKELSDNQKIDQDDYVFYITSAGSDVILYQSNEMSYNNVGQYVLVIRENKGSGTSPFTIDRISEYSGGKEFPDADSEARYRVYNGITKHDLQPQYEGLFDLHVDGYDESAEISSLALGEFSDTLLTDFGDYSIGLTIPDSNEVIIENHLLSLDINSNKSLFFYLLEEEVDEDGDGDYDEDGDGYVDEWKITINSLVVDNSLSESIYNHQIKVVNLVDDFDYLYAYFVRSDETIESSSNYAKATYIIPKTINLINNTYTVNIIGKEDSTDLILATYELVLDENSRDSFLILEENSDSPTGYHILLTNQVD